MNRLGCATSQRERGSPPLRLLYRWLTALVFRVGDMDGRHTPHGDALYRRIEVLSPVFGPT